MKKYLLVLACALAFGSAVAVAETGNSKQGPSAMTSAEMSQVVAGATVYLWENKDGDYHLTGATAKFGNGNKNGWVTYTGRTCDTVTFDCDGGGTIAESTDLATGKTYWTYIVAP
jgi:hypothetical protein